MVVYGVPVVPSSTGDIQLENRQTKSLEFVFTFNTANQNQNQLIRTCDVTYTTSGKYY